MEPTGTEVKQRQLIFMAECRVVQVRGGDITINLGKNVHLTTHLGAFPHAVKEGDTLPLYTTVPVDGKTVKSPVQ